MGFSAIIPAALQADANAKLEAAGFGPENFSVPLWSGDNPVPAYYGLNEGGDLPAFKDACEIISNVSIRIASSDDVEFDVHVNSLGLRREQYISEEGYT
jgi:hypothetical protein